MVKSLVHASRVLEAFQSAGDVLRLRDVVTRTGYNKGMCFRLLYTLHQCGFLDKVGQNHYRLVSEMRRRRLYRIGYAAQGQDGSFDKEVRAGLVRAAEREHIELLVVDNRYQPKIALRTADYPIKEQVDLLIEFQTDEPIAPAIASKYMQANIPFIAIDIPHPGATYFGKLFRGQQLPGGIVGQALSGPLGQAALERRGGRDSADRAAPRRVAAQGSYARDDNRHRRGAATHRTVPHGIDRWRRAVSEFARARAQTLARIESEANPGGRGQRSYGVRRAARLPGGGPRQ
jgi:hypothetical protein